MLAAKHGSPASRPSAGVAVYPTVPHVLHRATEHVRRLRRCRWGKLQIAMLAHARRGKLRASPRPRLGQLSPVLVNAIHELVDGQVLWLGLIDKVTMASVVAL